MDADAVSPLRHLMDEMPGPQGAHAKGQVGAVLLYRADAYDDDRRGLVIQPVLESGPSQLVYPELLHLAFLGRIAHRK